MAVAGGVGDAVGLRAVEGPAGDRGGARWAQGVCGELGAAECAVIEADFRHPALEIGLAPGKVGRRVADPYDVAGDVVHGFELPFAVGPAVYVEVDLTPLVLVDEGHVVP